MKIHHLAISEALKSLNSGPEGLSHAEAKRRLQEFGLNRVERVRKQSLFPQFLKGFTHFFALILWVAAGLAFFAEWKDPGAGMATLGFAILGVILINALFSFAQEFRAEKAISALQKLLPRLVKSLRDGKVVQIPAEELVPGDLILLEEGDDIPADCRLIQAFGVRVNNATITGESLAKARNEHPSQEEDLTQSKNILLAGTSMVSGQARALVFATGMHTEFGKIAHLTQTEGEALSPLQDVRIYASGNLDEYMLRDLVATAPIDGFGIGSRMDISADAPYLDCAYKLQEYEGRPRRKRSEGKATWPGRKQVYRFLGSDGRMAYDVLTLEEDPQEGQPLIQPFMQAGKRLPAGEAGLGPSPSLSDLRERTAAQLALLPEHLRKLEEDPPYEFRISQSLQDLAHAVDARGPHS